MYGQMRVVILLNKRLHRLHVQDVHVLRDRINRCRILLYRNDLVRVLDSHGLKEPTMKTVLVLGARGRFGSAAVRAFARAGWRVVAQVRPGVSAPAASVANAGTATRVANLVAKLSGPPAKAGRNSAPVFRTPPKAVCGL